MTYETAKQLRDAGYPLKTANRAEELTLAAEVRNLLPEQYAEKGFVAIDGQGYFLPTLSELIEACMQVILAHNSDETWLREDLWFFQLAPNINSHGVSTEIGKVSEWRATLDKGADPDNIFEGNNYFGATPEEAVAALWLSLNPPQKET